MLTQTKALSTALYEYANATHSRIAREAAERLDIQVTGLNVQRRRIAELMTALEMLINEPQPLGIERVAYQNAINALDLTECAVPHTDTSKLQALARRASYGVWAHTFCDKKELRKMINKEHIRVVADCTWGAPPGVCQVVYANEDCGAYDISNAAFIAAANPIAITALLDEIDGLRQKLASCISLNASDK